MNRISKDDIRTLIVVLTVCILSVIIVLIMNRKSNSEKLTAVNEYNTYFSIVSYVNKYLSNISNGSFTETYYLLDKEYINDNNITPENVSSNLKEYPVGSTIKVKEMSTAEIKNNNIYYINGNIYQNEMDSSKLIEEDYKILVKIDFNNSTFSIYPLETNNYKKIINKIKEVNIDYNNYNKISSPELITKEQVCVLYFSDFVYIINNSIDKSYELISEKQKREEGFSTIDNYKNYINSNREKITTLADKCLEDSIKDNRIYTVIDKNNNKYIFTEKSIMDYEVEIYLNDKIEDKAQQ